MRETKNRSPQRRIAAVVGALALGVIGVGGVAAPALAADPEVGNIDQARTDGTINIHKGIQKGGSAEGSPTGSEPAGFEGLPGVRFTAYRITSVDTATTAGWELLNGWATTPPASISDGTACSPTPNVTGQTVAGTGTQSPATDSDGLASITGLSVGAYLVCETQSPSTVVDKAQPFIISIPYPDSTTGGWLYNPHVFPKNGIATVDKTVAPQGSLGLGSTVSFPTEVTVPSVAAGSTFTHFWIQDPLDSRLSGGTATVTATGVTLTAGTDYNVLPASSTNGNLVTVVFTRAGLDKLEAAPGAKVTATFTGTVTSLAPVAPNTGTVGALNNVAYLNSDTAKDGQPGTTGEPADPDTTPGSGSDNPGNPTIPGTGNPGYPGTPSNPGPDGTGQPVTSYWGDVQLHKVDKATPANGLAGAKFQVFEAATPYAATEAECAITTPAGATPIEVSGQTEFTSITDGVLSIPGLFVKDSEGTGTSSAFRCYVLKEIEAPAGYVTPTGDAAFKAVAVKVGATDTSVAYDATVPNTQISGVQLPMTGSDGIIVFSVAGAALVALGLIVATASRRRRSHTA